MTWLTFLRYHHRVGRLVLQSPACSSPTGSDRGLNSTRNPHTHTQSSRSCLRRISNQAKGNKITSERSKRVCHIVSSSYSLPTNCTQLNCTDTGISERLYHRGTDGVFSVGETKDTGEKSQKGMTWRREKKEKHE